LEINYSIKVYKQYFNFSAAHFLVYEESREFLHGHNYKVSIKGDSLALHDDKVFDFLDVKPVVKKVCDSLDHKLLLPSENQWLAISEDGNSYNVNSKCDDSRFSFPKSDALLLPFPNISAERLAMYISKRVYELIAAEFDFKFSALEVEVEETPGQAAIYVLRGDL